MLFTSGRNMHDNELTRRQFQKMAMAALGGLVVGAGLAHSDDKKEVKPKDPKKELLLQEPNICRGLNICKTMGKGGKNDCAGMSACATAKAHTCAGENDCAGLGGCGEMPGENKCKAMGKCKVPLKDEAWTAARKRFETVMKKAEKKFGDAPKKDK
jgi:hypothetical protein